MKKAYKENRLFISYLSIVTMMPKNFIKRNYELFDNSEDIYIKNFCVIMFRRALLKAFKPFLKKAICFIGKIIAPFEKRVK